MPAAAVKDVSNTSFNINLVAVVFSSLVKAVVYFYKYKILSSLIAPFSSQVMGNVSSAIPM